MPACLFSVVWCGLVGLVDWLERHTYSLYDMILILRYGEAIYNAHPMETSSHAKGGSQGLFSVGKKVSN